MANETHNGNLNRSKIASAGTEGTKSCGKSNDSEATLRKGSLPKPEAVRHAEEVKGSAANAAKKQYESAGVPPQGSNHPTKPITSEI